MAERFFAVARTGDLIVQEMGPETLVFDRRTDVAHNLSPVAALVWSLCDGKHDVAELVTAVAAIQPEGAELAVEAALANLSEKDLLIEGVSRRGAITKMAKFGAGAFAVPMVVSVMAPAAAMAASQLAGTRCTQNSDCAAGLICTRGGDSSTANRYCNVSGCRSDGVNPSGNCVNSACCSGQCTNNGSTGACQAHA
jgi:hypothetical protein